WPATVRLVFSALSPPSTAPTPVIPQHRATRTAPATISTMAQLGIPRRPAGDGPATCQGPPAPGGGAGGESTPSAFSTAPGNGWLGGVVPTGARPVLYSMFPLISTFLLLTLNCHFAYTCPQVIPTGEASARIGTPRHSKVRASTTIRAMSAASFSGTERTISSWT